MNIRRWSEASRKAAKTRRRMKVARETAKETAMPNDDFNLLGALSDKDLVDILTKTGAAFARKILVDDGRENLHPAFFFFGAQGIMNLTLDFSSAAAKQHSYAGARLLLKASRARVYTLIAEAWAATYEPGELPEEVIKGGQLPDLMPSDHPNRIEIATIITCTRAIQGGVDLEIVRDGAGKVTALKDLKRRNHDGVGEMVSLFGD